MIRKEKSHDDSVKIKQIIQSEKVETERKRELHVRVVEKGNETATG